MRRCIKRQVFSCGTRAGPRRKRACQKQEKGDRGKIYDAWSVGVLQVEEESSFGIQSRSNWIGLVTTWVQKIFGGRGGMQKRLLLFGALSTWEGGMESKDENQEIRHC